MLKTKADRDFVKAVLFVIFIILAMGFAGYQDRIDAERGNAPVVRNR